MTRDEILSRVRLNLDDAGVTFWSSQDASDSIQDGYDDVAVTTLCIEKTTTLTAVSGLLYYNFYRLISDYICTKAIFNGNTNQWLTPLSISGFRSYDTKWETVPGQPYLYCPVSFEYVALWPVYIGVAQNYTVLYSAQADILGATTVPQIPTQFQTILEDFVTADLLEQAEEDAKADHYWIQYLKKQIQLKQYMLDRMRERILMLSGELRG